MDYSVLLDRIEAFLQYHTVDIMSDQSELASYIAKELLAEKNLNRRDLTSEERELRYAIAQIADNSASKIYPEKNVIHDWNNFYTVIIGNIQIAQKLNVPLNFDDLATRLRTGPRSRFGQDEEFDKTARSFNRRLLYVLEELRQKEPLGV